MPEEVLIRYPRRRFIRWLLRGGIRTAFSTFSDLHVEGREYLPKVGPALVVANHFSFLDPVALIGITEEPLEFFSGLHNPGAPAWSTLFPKLWGVLRVRRGGSSREALLAGEQILNQKGILSIFPEGGNWATVLRPPRPGAALVAARANAPIIPIGFDGLLGMFPLNARRRAKVDVRIGKPIGPFYLDPKRDLRQQLDEIGHAIMRAIAVLIPPERRGFYSDDPKIREAAKGTEKYPWEGLVEE
jgi:1-acyl-sn-glycerol-3-phosphate acyltransferase